MNGKTQSKPLCSPVTIDLPPWLPPCSGWSSPLWPLRPWSERGKLKQEQVDTYPKSTFSPAFPFHRSYQSHQPQLPSPKPQYSYPHTVPSHPPTVPSQNLKQEIISSAPPTILKHYPDVQTTHSFHHPGGDQTVTYPSVPSPYSASMLNSTALASMRAPQLPPFSGESQKGDVSFEVWKY